MSDMNARLTRLLVEGIKLCQRVLNKKPRVIDFLYNISNGAYQIINNSRLSALPDLNVEKIMKVEGPWNKFDIINNIVATIHIYLVHPNEYGYPRQFSFTYLCRLPNSRRKDNGVTEL
jgi:hypothetical protein